MTTSLDNLKTARDQIASQLADMTANPKPTYSIAGRSVSWGEHFNNLSNQFEKMQTLINQLTPTAHFSRGKV